MTKAPRLESNAGTNGTTLLPDRRFYEKPTSPLRSSIDVFVSPFLEALDNRKIGIRVRRNHAPMITAYGLLHRRMNRAITLALDTVEKYEDARKLEGFGGDLSGQPSFASDAFVDAVYKAAELFEFYDSDIVDYLEPSLTYHQKSRYKKALKEITGHWDRLCNGCKHNHSFIVPIEGKYADGAWVSGYSSYRHEGQEMRIDKGIHRFSDVLSYNWSFRRLMGSILEADIAATMLVKSIPDDPFADAIDSNLIPLPYSHILPRISGRALDAFPGEHKLRVPQLSLFGQGGREQPLFSASPTAHATECSLLCVFEITTATMAIQQPYSDNIARFALSRGAGADRVPLAGFYRMVMNGVSVPPKEAH